MIHPTAIIDASARIGADVTIGPYCIIGADVEIGEGSWLQHHVTVMGPTKVGKRNQFYAFGSIGQRTQEPLPQLVGFRCGRLLGLGLLHLLLLRRRRLSSFSDVVLVHLTEPSFIRASGGATSPNCDQRNGPNHFFASSASSNSASTIPSSSDDVQPGSARWAPRR